MAREFHKFGPLIAEVHSSGVEGMFLVRVIGLGMEFETYVPGPEEDMEAIAFEVIGQLHEAATKPRLFMAKRHLIAEQTQESQAVKDKMLSLAQKAVDFASVMRPYLERAVHAEEAPPRSGHCEK